MPVIEVEHLHKRYRDTVAVEDVSFTVERGEIFGIIGPNGAGKRRTSFDRPSGGQRQRLSIALALVGNPEATGAAISTTPPTWPASACPRPAGPSRPSARSRWSSALGDALAEVAKRWSPGA